jgi:hypothetical protein
VLLREPLKPTLPALDHPMAVPFFVWLFFLRALLARQPLKLPAFRFPGKRWEAPWMQAPLFSVLPLGLGRLDSLDQP